MILNLWAISGWLFITILHPNSAVEKCFAHSSESKPPNCCVALATSSASNSLRYLLILAFNEHSTLLPLLSFASCLYRAQKFSQFPNSLKASTTVCPKILG